MISSWLGVGVGERVEERRYLARWGILGGNLGQAERLSLNPEFQPAGREEAER